MKPWTEDRRSDLRWGPVSVRLLSVTRSIPIVWDECNPHKEWETRIRSHDRHCLQGGLTFFFDVSMIFGKKTATAITDCFI